ncbi:MAG: hypothetical protein E7259_03360 [Lachnospiraceae bacterium]|nr:hypothetical protein [Lachnospiraceae bacterium]
MILYILTVVSILTIFVLCFTGIVQSIVLAPIIAIGMFILFVLLWCLSAFIYTRSIDLKKEYDEYSAVSRYYANNIIDSLNIILNIKVHVSGLDILPDEKFLFVCNHRSAMDPLITMGILRDYNMGFVAKKSIYKVPVIANLMHRCYCLCLDRKNIREEAKTILRAGKLVKEQRASIGIYPEGTRNKGEGLLPFLGGSFKIAKKANAPIVVASIKNPEKIFKDTIFKKTHVYLDFLQVIDKEFVASHNTTELSEEARQIIAEKL